VIFLLQLAANAIEHRQGKMSQHKSFCWLAKKLDFISTDTLTEPNLTNLN